MERGSFVVGDIEVDQPGHILFAPSKEEIVARLAAASDAALASGS
jgi:hypothetical protein